MRRISLLTFSVVLPASVVSGCGDATHPISPGIQPAADAAAQGTGNESAMGHAGITFGTVFRNFTFNAVRQKDGSVVGHFDLHVPAVGVRQAGEITCMDVFAAGSGESFGVGRLGGFITKSTTGAEGVPVFFTVVDGGEGARDPSDLLSPLFGGTSEDVEQHCTAGSEVSVFPIENGNIQVHVMSEPT